MVDGIVAIGGRGAPTGAGEAATASKELPAHPGVNRFIVSHRHMAELPEMDPDAQQKQQAVGDPFRVEARELDPAIKQRLADGRRRRCNRVSDNCHRSSSQTIRAPQKWASIISILRASMIARMWRSSWTGVWTQAKLIGN